MNGQNRAGNSLEITQDNLRNSQRQLFIKRPVKAGPTRGGLSSSIRGEVKGTKGQRSPWDRRVNFFNLKKQYHPAYEPSVMSQRALIPHHGRRQSPSRASWAGVGHALSDNLICFGFFLSLSKHADGAEKHQVSLQAANRGLNTLASCF